MIADASANIRDYGAVGDGTTDDTAAIQAAIDATVGVIYMPAGNYKITSSLLLASGKSLYGESKQSVWIDYYGTGSALVVSGIASVESMSITVNSASANGIEIGNGSRNSHIKDIYVDATAVGATTTGAGIYLNAGTQWSGGLNITNLYSLQFKYGILMRGTNLTTGTWTTVHCYNIFLYGNTGLASPIAGSAGIYMDSLTNGIGTTVLGGTIETMQTAIYVENDSHGGMFDIDMEDNTDNYNVGDAFRGYIRSSFNQNVLDVTQNPGAANRFKSTDSNGKRYLESRYPNHYNLFEDSQGKIETLWTRHPDFIDNKGAVSALDLVTYPYTRKFAIGVGDTGVYGPSVHPDDHYVELGGMRITYGSTAPSDAAYAYARGSIRYNIAPVAAGKVGWVCITAGSPGTWKAFGVIDT